MANKYFNSKEEMIKVVEEAPYIDLVEESEEGIYFESEKTRNIYETKHIAREIKEYFENWQKKNECDLVVKLYIIERRDDLSNGKSVFTYHIEGTLITPAEYKYYGNSPIYKKDSIRKPLRKRY